MVVGDSGHGIPPEIQDHIFHPYFSTKGTRYRNGPGARGEVDPPAPGPARVQDRPRGDDLLDHPALQRPERERRWAMSNEPFPILIVDDEPNIRTGLARALECESYAISTAKDADEASDCSERSGHLLVLTDLKMPGATSGIDLIRAIKDERPETLIIVITAHGTVETAVEAMRLGADDYLSKPIDLGTLAIAGPQRVRALPPEGREPPPPRAPGRGGRDSRDDRPIARPSARSSRRSARSPRPTSPS